MIYSAVENLDCCWTYCYHIVCYIRQYVYVRSYDETEATGSGDHLQRDDCFTVCGIITRKHVNMSCKRSLDVFEVVG